MKLKILFYLILGFVSKQLTAQNILIPKLNKTIDIDGDLSDWETPFLGPFVIHNSGEKPTQLTYVSLSWNAKSLFIAYRCLDRKVIGAKRQNDTPLFSSDDLVEFFIDPDGDTKNYLEVGVNAFSSHYDLIVKCITKECGGWKNDINLDVKAMKTVARLIKGGYTVEIEVPFASLNNLPNANFETPKAGTKWKGNFFRIDFGKSTEYQSLQSYETKKHGFHQPTEFATLEFTN